MNQSKVVPLVSQEGSGLLSDFLRAPAGSGMQPKSTFLLASKVNYKMEWVHHLSDRQMTTSIISEYVNANFAHVAQRYFFLLRKADNFELHRFSRCGTHYLIGRQTRGRRSSRRWASF